MNVGDLICRLMKMPYDRPVEIETIDGERLEIVDIDNPDYGVTLIATDNIQSGSDAADLFDSMLDVVKAVEGMKQSQLGEAFKNFDKFGDLCEVTDGFIDQYVREEDLK